MTSLLVPVSVVAKVVKTRTSVPSLSGAPFNTELALEAGIHVHWALPDALTRAKTVGQGTASHRVIFPGVPDLWLVVRFNPATAGVATRGWKAWVVDSRAKTVTALDKWTTPAAPDAKTTHTLPGVLPTDDGNPGWGRWDSSQTDFDTAITSAVYYPTGRTRFGLYDDLSGLTAGGSVSYTVVGWYSSTDGDPLFKAADAEKQITDWALSYEHHRSAQILATLLAGATVQVATPAWKPTLTMAPEVQTRSASAQQKTAMETTAARTAKMQVLQQALPTPAVGAAVVAPVYTSAQPTQLVCHGSVLDVPLNATVSASALSTSQLAVYPSVKRALAAVTSPHLSDQQLDYAEMMLQDLDHQRGTMAGVIDMPGAAHALTFQNVSGKPTYYAQLKIADTLTRAAAAKEFSLVSAADQTASGHWPETLARSTLPLTSKSASQAATANGARQPAPSSPQAPPPPTADQIKAWQDQLTQAFNQTATTAASAGTPIDAKLMRVVDSRAKAKPLGLLPSVNGSGTDGGTYWVRIDDPDALTALLIATTGADVQLPDKDHLYTQPGPRWYRPWSPQIVVSDAHRSYRFGEDGRYSEDGRLECRTSGYTAYGISSNSGTLVQGSALVANAAGITSVSGLPPEVPSLLYEAVILDTGSTPALAVAAAPVAARLAAQEYFTAAIQGVYLQRLNNLTPATAQAIGKIQVKGTPPGHVALTPWQDPYDPLYLDANYSLLYTSLEKDWQLAEDQVEMTPATAAATSPPAAQTEVFNERSRVTASIAKILESTLVTQRSLDPIGTSVARQKPPNGLTAQAFQTMDTLSAPLVGFDAALVGRGYRERDGILRVNKVNLVDVFGITRAWSAGSGVAPSTTLTPRFPFWSRLSFRLQSAADQNQEANSYTPAVCGILLPDFVDHTLQVFDGSGSSIGQLSSDLPRFGGGAAGSLGVHFQVYPWVTPPSADPLSAISNPILRQVVAGLLAQQVVIPAQSQANTWYETGLTAMLRTIDTVRATLDPKYSTPDHKVRLLGEPILVMVGRLKLEATAETDSQKVKQGPQALVTPPALPSISVRIGDITRPDDGVLGFFIPNESPAASRYAPVSKDAADKAILNGLSLGIPVNSGLPVTHPFVKNQVNVIKIQATDPPKDVIMLTDIRGDIYATCGVLPRKSIQLPKAFLDASLANMEPVFRVGPVFTMGTTPDVKPLFPPPQVPGYDASFVYSAPGAANPYPNAAMPPALPLGDLPPARVTLNEGWVRLQQRKSGS